MKVVAIDSSPKAMGISKDQDLLDALANGMRDAGADVETIQLRQKTVRKTAMVLLHVLDKDSRDVRSQAT